jgi:hypothetical protein
MSWYQGKVRDPLLPGEPVTLKGQEFTIARLNIKRSIEIAKVRDELDGVAPSTEMGIGMLVRVAGIAIRANYPELDDNLLEEELGVNELAEILKAHAAAERAAKAQR